MSNPLHNFLSLPYAELEERNLKIKDQRVKRVSPDKIREERLKALTDDKGIKAVTLMFSDLEGRLHMLDYDKKFLVKSWDNLTFDGSSIRGFTAQRESDLRLGVDWGAFYYAPADYFGSGKVLVFGEVIDKDGSPYMGDMRAVLKHFSGEQHKKNGLTLNAANEIEGFLFQGADAERNYSNTGKFEYVNTGGYYHCLPGDPLRRSMPSAGLAGRDVGVGDEVDVGPGDPASVRRQDDRPVHLRQLGEALRSELGVEEETARADAEHLGTVPDDDERAHLRLQDAVDALPQRRAGGGEPEDADRVQAAEPVLARATSRLPVDARVFADLESAAMRLGHADLARSARARHAALTCQTSC